MSRGLDPWGYPLEEPPRGRPSEWLEDHASVTVEADPRCPAQIAHAKWCAENAGLVERQMSDAAREWREFAEKWRRKQAR